MAGKYQQVHHDDGNDVEDSGSDREEDCLIKQRKSSQHPIRRVSTNCTHLTVACPTCKGKGKLSQAQSDTVVALIPMNDNRLVPRRTTLKLVIAFCCILVVAGLCLAFLFPRKVQLSVVDASPAGYSENDKRLVINITVMARVTNTNFFSVRLTNITTEVLFLSTVDLVPHEVGLALSNNIEHFGIREERELKLFVNTVYLKRDAERIKKICLWNANTKDEKWHFFPVRISLSANLKYWSHNEQIDSKTLFYIECRQKDFAV